LYGILASYTLLKAGIENACTRMREKMMQHPFIIALDSIPHDFCLESSDACQSTSAAASSPG